MLGETPTPARILCSGIRQISFYDSSFARGVSVDMLTLLRADDWVPVTGMFAHGIA
jgi:hypothetical protein